MRREADPVRLIGNLAFSNIKGTAGNSRKSRLEIPMYTDALTIAGLACIASYALMPILMGREFVRVAADTDSVAEASTPNASTPEASNPRAHRPRAPKPITSGAVTHA